MSKRILILGGHGFIGSHTGHILKEQNCIIGVVDCYHRYYTCLLYTSPSPRDHTRSRMPSSA